MKNREITRNAEIKQKGFTLIEVMIAMVIMGIGLVSIVVLQARNMAYNSSSKRQTQAYTWAMDRAERLLALKYTDPDLNVGIGHQPNAADAGMMAPYIMRWNVVDNTANIPNSRKVSILVRWKNKVIARVDTTRVQSSI